MLPGVPAAGIPAGTRLYPPVPAVRTAAGACNYSLYTYLGEERRLSLFFVVDRFKNIVLLLFIQ